MKIIKYKKQLGVGGFSATPITKKYVNEVLKTGRLSYGPFLKSFEKKFAEIHNRRFGISVNSGTSALQVAVHALKSFDGWQDGDEILVPALTFIATSNVVLSNNLKPVFVDIDKRTYNIDPKNIEKKITKKTRAIMPVNLCGLPANMKAIMKIAKKHKLRVIEDSCETMFVKRDGEMVGSLSDIACFSTYVAHLLTTGVGGLVLTNDKEIAIKLRSLVNHGRDSIYLSIDDDKNKSGGEMKEIISRRFSFIDIGYSYRLTEFEGALGLAGLAQWKENITARKKNARMLLNGLAQFSDFLQLPYIPRGAEHAFMMFPITVINKKINMIELVNWLESWNIETRPLFPLLNQPIYQKIFGDLEPKYPIATFVRKNGFYIGCHPQLKSADISYIISVFKDFFKLNKLQK
ncbi:MAG: DegT/DnrJ/EryC1/StrS family aminotransferase [bacterium]|nr:DegT/DnrJ/EryC1/StrS family aminotransferase [bacterium]